MRLMALLFTAILTAAPDPAQQPQPSAAPESPSGEQDKTRSQESKNQGRGLPVSVAKIREALEQTPAISLRALDERPTFRIQILERQKIEELLSSLNFKAGPVPAGGVGLCGQLAQVVTRVDHL